MSRLDTTTLRILTSLVLAARPELMAKEGVPRYIETIVTIASEGHGLLFNERHRLKQALDPDEYDLVARALHFEEIENGNMNLDSEEALAAVRHVLDAIARHGIMGSGILGGGRGEA